MGTQKIVKKAAFATSVQRRATCCNAEPKKSDKPIKKDKKTNVLISNLNSKRNQPELDLSAMDGYAVRKRDLSSLPKKFELVGEIKAGDTISKAVKKNQTFRILLLLAKHWDKNFNLKLQLAQSEQLKKKVVQMNF